MQDREAVGCGGFSVAIFAAQQNTALRNDDGRQELIER
jgi:hypothetical protein